MELKPCPFCGGKVTHEIDSWNSMSWVDCPRCGRMLATRCDGLPDDPPSPVVIFNRRPLEDALTVSRDEWKTRACQEELRADALEIERDRYREALELIDRTTRDYGIGIGATCNNTAHYALESVHKVVPDAKADQ